MIRFFTRVLSLCFLIVVLGCGSGGEAPDNATTSEKADSDSKAEIAKTEKNESTAKYEPDPKPHQQSPEKDDTSSDPDEERILGTWHSTRSERDGKVDPEESGGKTVFREDEVYLHGLPLTYTLDSTKSPKHLNLDSVPAIYLLHGDTLTICMASASEQPRPTDFMTENGDGRQLIVLARSKPLDPELPDADFDRDLKFWIRRWIASLENDFPAEFLDEFEHPDTVRTIREKGQWNEARERVMKEKNRYLVTLKALQKITPKINATGTTATFDLAPYHIEGGLWLSEMEFVELEGEWRSAKP